MIYVNYGEKKETRITEPMFLDQYKRLFCMYPPKGYTMDDAVITIDEEDGDVLTVEILSNIRMISRLDMKEKWDHAASRNSKKINFHIKSNDIPEQAKVL